MQSPSDRTFFKGLLSVSAGPFSGFRGSVGECRIQGCGPAFKIGRVGYYGLLNHTRILYFPALGVHPN